MGKGGGGRRKIRIVGGREVGGDEKIGVGDFKI